MIEQKERTELARVYEQAPADYWDTSYKTNLLQKLYYDIRFCVANKMLTHVPRGGSVLDVGCSSGFSIEHYAKQRLDIHYTGTDIAEHNIAYAKKHRSQFRFEHAPAESLPFADTQFDAITMLDVIEHVIDADTVLKEAHRVLKPGGLLIIFVAQEHHPLFQIIWWAWIKAKGKVWDHAHLRVYNKKTLISDIEKAGFKLQEFKRSHGTTCMTVKAQRPK